MALGTVLDSPTGASTAACPEALNGRTSQVPSSVALTMPATMSIADVMGGGWAMAAWRMGGLSLMAVNMIMSNEGATQ